jgi:hypothetical protein
MINYTPKQGLLEEIARQGYELYLLNGQWVSDNDQVVQAIIDNYIEPATANWDQFNLMMMSDSEFNQVYNTCLAQFPIIANALPTALDQVTTRGNSLFTLIWDQICTIGQATTEMRIKWAGFGEYNNLPSDFVEILRG